VAIAVAGAIAIVGILQEKSWAKWVAIAIYGLYILALPDLPWNPPHLASR
jgi:hypothetical protein